MHLIVYNYDGSIVYDGEIAPGFYTFDLYGRHGDFFYDHQLELEIQAPDVTCPDVRVDTVFVSHKWHLVETITWPPTPVLDSFWVVNRTAECTSPDSGDQDGWDVWIDLSTNIPAGTTPCDCHPISNPFITANCRTYPTGSVGPGGFFDLTWCYEDCPDDSPPP